MVNIVLDDAEQIRPHDATPAATPCMRSVSLATYPPSMQTPSASTQQLLMDSERSDASSGRPSSSSAGRTAARRSMHVQFEPEYERPQHSRWHRFRGIGRRVPTVWESFRSLRSHTSVNLLFVFLPVAWAGNFFKNGEGEHYFGPPERFALNLLAIIPLQKRFEWLGEEMIPYLGAELGELLLITLSNAVEGALAIALLARDNYRLLQITVIGVVLLHVLLVPGVAFLTGGARIIEQELHSGKTQLNHTLLTLGVMSLVLPAAFFAALDRGNLEDLTKYVTHLNTSEHEETGELAQHAEYSALLTDARRGQFLQFSRGISVLLLISYVCSRIYLHNPPGQRGALHRQSSVLRQRTLEREERDSSVHPGFGTAAIAICVALMAVTAQYLIQSLEEVLEHSHLSEEFFGLVILPFISFAGDAFLSVLHFTKRFRTRGHDAHGVSDEPEGVASGISIDLSIQFLMVWMPVFVLVAWCTHKPLLLLFDLLEVALVVAACFLVNFVTADAKTNWAEGSAMIFFYIMIALVSWYYPGQIEVRIFVGKENVAHAVLNGPTLDG